MPWKLEPARVLKEENLNEVVEVVHIGSWPESTRVFTFRGIIASDYIHLSLLIQLSLPAKFTPLGLGLSIMTSCPHLVVHRF